MSEPSDDKRTITMVHEVFPGDTNCHGTMFGGLVVALMDKAAGICASKFAQEDFVTASVDRLKFLAPMKVGNVIEIIAEVVYTSRHTVGLRVIAYTHDRKTWEGKHCCTANFFMVAVDENGRIIPIRQFVPTTEEEKRQFEEVRGLHMRIKK